MHYFWCILHIARTLFLVYHIDITNNSNNPEGELKMKKTIEEMKQKNGYFEINGREYVLTEQASFQSDPVRILDGWK